MAPRPKYVAARSFRHGQSVYEAGDPITDGGALQALLVHGDKFVTNTATRQADTPTNPGPDEGSAVPLED